MRCDVSALNCFDRHHATEAIQHALAKHIEWKGIVMPQLQPTGLLENTQSGIYGQLPGEDPKTLHKHYDAGLSRMAAGASAFLQVKSSGQYVNIDSSGWAIILPSAQTKFVLVPYYEDHYVVVASGEWKGYYLSFNSNSYVGAYSGWANARYWAVEPLNCSPYPGLYSFKSSGTAYLCCGGVKDNIDDLIEIFSA